MTFYKKSISIIIPVYNCELYIKKCLDSIFHQKKAIECEVILVDDCSTDNSVQIIENAIKDHDNAILIRQKHNAGVGAARNKGIQQAHGEYLFFVDADDCLVSNSLHILNLELRKKENLDLLIFSYRWYYEEDATFHPMNEKDYFVYSNKKFKNNVVSIEEAPQLLECSQYPWNLLYRRTFIEENTLSCRKWLIFL